MVTKNSLHTGVTFYDEDRGKGPFGLRIGGTSDFVSKIDAKYDRCWPPGLVTLIDGWDTTQWLKFETMDEALDAADQVVDIEGFHVSIEIVRHTEIEDDWTCTSQGEQS